MTRVATTTAAAETGSTEPSRPDRRRDVAVLGAYLLAAWLVPVVTHLLSVDIVLPVLVWLALACLLRTGRNLLDRLVVAAAALIGAVAIGGLLFSVWPWHLAPVPVAGLAFTVLIGLAAGTGRRPALGNLGSWSDLPVLGTGLAALGVAAVPLLRADFAGRLAMAVPGEDLSRHFVMYDTIGRLGGYLFQRPGAGDLVPVGLVGYPQGSHLGTALLDSFLRSGAPVPAPATAFDHYLGWNALAFGLLGLVLAWAVRWVAADLLDGWWALPVLAAVVGISAFAVYVTLVMRGYPSEIVGLIPFAVAVALLVRSPGDCSAAEYLAVLGLLVAAVSFSHYFYLPPLALFAGYLGWRRWDRLRARGWLVPVVAVGTAVVAAVPPLVNRSVPVGDTVLLGGPVVAVDRLWLLLFTVVVAAPVLLARVRRDPTWQAAVAAAAGCWLFAVAVGGFQYLRSGGVSYYFEKALHAVVIAETLLLGAVGYAAAVAFTRVGARIRRPRVVEPVLAVLAALLVLAGFGALDPRHTPAGRGFPPTAPDGASYGRAYLEGRLRMTPEAESILVATADQPVGPRGRLLIFWNCNGRGADFYTAQFAAALRRRFDDPAWNVMLRIPQPRTGDALPELLDDVHVPAEVVTRDPATADEVEKYRSAHSGADLTVLVLSG